VLICYAEITLESDGATIKDPAGDHHVLYHERGFTEQIVWCVETVKKISDVINHFNRSTCGSYVLTRSPRGIKIFTKVWRKLGFPHHSETVTGWRVPEDLPSHT